jgi:hypothetical protein
MMVPSCWAVVIGFSGFFFLAILFGMRSISLVVDVGFAGGATPLGCWDRNAAAAQYQRASSKFLSHVEG